jgi:hypothetical protein
VQRFTELGVSPEHLTILLPGARERVRDAVPTDEGEPQGTGAAIGAALENTLPHGVPRDDLFI